MSPPITETNWTLPEEVTSSPSSEIAKIREKLERILATTGNLQGWNEVVIEKQGSSPVVCKRTHMGDLVIDISATSADAVVSSNLGTHEKTTTTIADVLEIIQESEGPAVTTEEVAEQVDESVTVVQKRLTELEERGKIETRESGETTIWWEIEDDQDLLAGFGTFEESDVPELMKEEREQAREEWDNESTLSR